MTGALLDVGFDVTGDNSLTRGPQRPLHGFFGLTLALATLAMASLSSPATAAVEDGLSWLQTRAEPNGSFGTLPLRDTETAIAALASYGVGSGYVDGGLYFYLYEDSGAVDFASRRLRSLTAADLTTPDEIDAIKALRNSDWGWGPMEGYSSSVADTSQALLTLGIVGEPDLDLVGESLGFLAARQQGDGGFAWEDNSDSDPLLTAEVLLSLAVWSEIFDLSELMGDTADYLYGLQGSDDLIASSLPNLSTALTLRATANLGGYDAEWTQAYAALAGAQALSGAWDNDVYVTSQALLALGSGRPDLAITSITPLADPIIEDELVTVEVTVENQGRVGLSQAVAVPIDYISGSTGSETRLATRSISSLAGGASTTLTVQWDTTGLAGAGFLKAHADPTGVLNESDLTDNVLLRPVTVLGGADLAVYAADGLVQPGSPAPEDTVSFYTTVYNFGALTLSGFSVTLHDGDPSAGGELLDTFTQTLSPGGSVDLSWSGSLDAGEHDLYVTVDPAGAVDETDETNNQAVTSVTVAPRIDLQIAAGQVRAAPDTVGEGQAITLSVTVYNGGRSPSGPFSVGAYLYDPETMASVGERVLMATAAVDDLAPGESTTRALSVDSTGYLGTVTLYGVADHAGAVDETAENNNESSDTVYIVEAPNLAVAAGGFTPAASATQGDTVSLTAVVENTGGGTIYNVPVGFYLDSTDSSRLGVAVIQQLDPGESAASPAVSWNTTSASPGGHTLIAKVDPDEFLAESSELDNTQSAAFTLNPRPDLIFTGAGLAASPTEPEQGEVVTLTANIRNNTSSAITTPFEVHFYDGSPNGGGSIIATATVASLGGDSTTQAQISWDTEGEAGRHTLYALLDATGAVVEGDETNNQDTLTLVVASGDADLEPPTGLQASVAGDNVTLNWTPAGSPAGYRVYRDGVVVNPPDLLLDLVPEATLEASSAVADHGAGFAADGSTDTYWEGEGDVDEWTFDAVFDEAQEVSAFRVILKAQGNLNLTLALQTYADGYYYTQESTTLTSGSTGVVNGVFRLKRNITTDRVRVFMRRRAAEVIDEELVIYDPGAIAELSVNPPSLVEGTSFEDINVDAATHLYEVRSTGGAGREGEPAELDVTLGDVLPPTDPIAITYADRTEIYWTRSTSTAADGYELVRDNLPLVNTQAITGLSAVASSTESGYPASAGVDNNGGTYWLSASGSSWNYDITLPSRQRLWGLTFYSAGGYHPLSYDILGWTGSEWIIEEQIRDNVFTARGHTFAQFGATTKVRIQVHEGASDRLALFEVQLTAAVPIDASGVTDGYRPDYAITYRVGAMSEEHVAFAETEPFSPPAGEEPPGPPDTLTVSDWTRTDLTLSWSAVSDANLAGYHVYDWETGEKLNDGLVVGTTFDVLGVIDPDDTSYAYAVTAVNTFGYESPFVRSYTWTPPLPAAPTLAASLDGTTVSLSWESPDEALRDGFTLFKDSAAYVDTPAKAYDDLDVSAGSHSYRVAGVDLFGRTGTSSNTESITVVRSDLELSADGLAFNPDPATILDTATVSAAVFNAGDQASAPTEVSFFDGDPDAGGSLIGTAALPAIAGYGLATVEVAWDLSGQEGDHALFAEVDPDDDIAELSEANNQASIDVIVYGEPGFNPSLGAIDPAAFPILSATLTVIDTYGEPVTGLGARFVTVAEGGGAATDITLIDAGAPGQYTLGWITPTRSRNGATRTATVTVTVDALTGSTTGSYAAPDDPITDFAALTLVADPAGPEEDDSFELVFTVANTGSETETNIPLTLFAGSVGGEVVGSTTLSSLEAGAQGTARIAAVGIAGSTAYIAVVDPADAFDEANESDNQATLSLFVPENPYPDLVIDDSRLALTPSSPEGGDLVGLTAVVENRGAATTSVQVQAYLGDPSAGGKTIGNAQTIASLGRRSEAEVSFSWDTTGLSGDQTILVWVDPINRIEERDETNNRGSRVVDVTAPRASLGLSLGQSAIGANTDLDVSARVNPGGGSFSGTVSVSIQTVDGAAVEDLTPITVGPISQETTFPSTWNSARSRAGDYQVLAVLREGGAERGRATSPFTILPERGLVASIASGLETYDAFQAAALSGELLNTSVNVALPDTAGTLTVTAPGGGVLLTESYGPQDLDLEQRLAVETTFDIADHPPGTYTLRLSGASGDIDDEATHSFEVRSTAVSGAGLVGLLELDKDQAVPGESVAATWSIQNRGNAGISDISGRIRIVDPEGGDVCNSATFTLTAAKGETAEGDEDLSTGCDEGTWSVQLQAELGGEWRTLDLAVLNLLPVRGEIEASPEEAEGGIDTVSIVYRASNQSDVRVESLSFVAEVIANDSGEVVQSWPWSLSLDAEDSQEVSQPLDSGSLSIGAYTATLYFTPEGSDPTPLASSAFSVVDRTPPTSLLTWDGETVLDDEVLYVPAATRAVIEASDNFSGIALVRYRYDGGEFITYASPFSLTGPGPHTLTYAARDLAGNDETEKGVDLVFDDAAPAVEVVGVEEGTCTAREVTIALDVTDVSPTQATMTVDGQAYSGGAITTPGRHIFEASVTDILGQTTVVSRTFDIVEEDCQCDPDSGCETPVADGDGDGFSPAEGDCDDIDPDRFPGADESCNSLDDDCDDVIDEGIECETGTPTVDTDDDGWADGVDCAPEDDQIHPGALEICVDGEAVDEDCDGRVDESCGTPSLTPTSTLTPTEGSDTPGGTGTDNTPSATVSTPTLPPTPTRAYVSPTQPLWTPGATQTVPQTTPIDIDTEEGGCECRSGGQTSTIPGWALFVLLLGGRAFIRRRRGC